MHAEECINRQNLQECMPRNALIGKIYKFSGSDMVKAFYLFWSAINLT